MAGVNKKDIPIEAEFMTEFWEAVKKYWIPEDNTKYWKECTEHMESLIVKYPSEFCKSQVVSFVEYLDRKQIHENEYHLQ